MAGAWDIGGSGLGSSLGSSGTGTNPSTGNPWDMGSSSSEWNMGGGSSATAAPAAPKSSGGNWFGSITNPLGLVSAVGGLATGLATGIGGIVENAAAGVGKTIGNVAATVDGNASSADWGGALNNFESMGKGLGDMGTGFMTMAEQLASTALIPTGLSGYAERDVFQPFNKWLGGANIISDQMHQELLGPDGQGMKPTNFIQDASQNGIGGALVHTASQLAAVAGVSAGVAGAIGGYSAAAAASAESAGALDAAAALGDRAAGVGKVTNVLEQAAHPYKFVGMNSADLLGAMREQAFPAQVNSAIDAAAPVVGKVAGAVNAVTDFAHQKVTNPFRPDAPATPDNVAAQDATVDPTLLAAARDEMAPAQAAAESMAGSNDAASAATDPALHPEDAATVQHTVDAAANDWVDKNIPAAEPGGNVSRAESSSNIMPIVTRPIVLGDVAKVDPYTKSIPVNKIVSVQGSINPDQVKAVLNGTEAPHPVQVMDAGNGNYILEDGNHRAAAAIARGDAEIPAEVTGHVTNKDLVDHVQGQLDKHPGLPDPIGGKVAADEAAAPGGPTELPKSTATVEPRSYDPSKGTPDTPEETAAKNEQLRSETAAARDAPQPALYVMDQLGRRINAGTPTWATNLAEKLPDSVNRTIGRLGANFVDAARYRNLYRNLMQAQETAQQTGRSSPGYREGEAGARLMLSSTVGRDVATARVGEEIHARLNGSAMVAEWTKAHDGFQPTPEQALALQRAALGGYTGITDAMRAKLTPEQNAALDVHINNAVEAFKQTAIETTKTLLASRFGAKGLESALLSPDEVPMSAEQLRMYRRSERDLRFAAKADQRIPAEIEKVKAEAAKALAIGLRQHNFLDELRAKLGTDLHTVDDLYKGLPKGMENDGAATIGVALDTFSKEGGVLMDIGKGVATHPTEGVYVPMEAQFDIPLEQWAASGQQAVHDAIFAPKGPAGKAYDSQRLYGGEDARLSINLAKGADGSQHVIGTLSQNTIGGAPMLPWQAYVLGSAHEAAAGFDFADGSSVPFATSPAEQALMMHYIGDVLNTNSELSRWANQRSTVVANNDMNITQADLHAEITSQLWLDHVLSDLNPQWQHGDLFKTTLAFAKGEPTLAYLQDSGVGGLAQTIMQDLPLNDHVARALTFTDAATVNSALAWYYDSHTFIESYRGQIVPLTGRDAAETFYDVLAMSSVMASPTQNLGRALAGFANLDDFLKTRADAFAQSKDVMQTLMGEKAMGPGEAVRVADLGKPTERVVPSNYEGQSTLVSKRWLESPELRALSNQTSMVTSAKYRIIDALLGRFDLSSATAEDIAGQPEFWTGKATDFSPTDITPEMVNHHADLLGYNGPDRAAYNEWAANHARITAASDVRTAAGRDYVAPITAAEDVQRIRAEREAAAKGEKILGGREVSAHEYQNLAQDGRHYVDTRLANSSPHVLKNAALVDSLYEATRVHTNPDGSLDEWGGATVDAHTGKSIPTSYRGDTFSVTARPRGMESVGVPVDASKAEFAKAYAKALVTFKKQLNSDGAHLGVFRNHDTGLVEIDPVYHTLNVHDTEAVGAYGHSNGGAFNFKTQNGYWNPHVKTDEHFATPAEGTKAVTRSAQQGVQLAKSPGLRPSFENAMMEHHGSSLLAKLRSFRDNLAHPETSLAVTLDSIMAQLFGFSPNNWDKAGEYAKHADMIRQSAEEWSKVAGRQVMPHEIQAVLWVYAKRFIGTQDWGRWQQSLSDGHDQLNAMESAVQAGKKITVQNFDPLGDLWHQELQFSRDQLAIREEKKALGPLRTNGTATPEQLARLQHLESIPTTQTTDVQVRHADGTSHVESRTEMPYNKTTLRDKEGQYNDYLTNVVGPMRKAIAEGDFQKAHSLLDQYVAGRRKAIMGSTDAGAFGQKMIDKNPKGVGAQSLRRLSTAEHVPSPEPHITAPPLSPPSPNLNGADTGALYEAFANRVRGLTLEHPNSMGRIMQRMYHTADVSTLLHEDMHAFRMMAPGDVVAELSKTYPHIQDATLTPERIADEERFVSDFMGYMRNKSDATDPRMSPAMRSTMAQRMVGPNSDLFNRATDLMAQHYGASLDTVAGRAVPQPIVDFWDHLFNRDIQKPNAVDDPLSAQYAPVNKGANPVQQRGETPAAFTQRTRQLGEAKGQVQTDQLRIQQQQQRTAQADKFANTMQGLVMEPTKSEIISQKLTDRATRTLGKIADNMQNANGNQVPRVWQAYMGAIDAIRVEAAKDPSLAPLLDEIPGNFAAALQHAAALGFEPTYMPELTFDMAQKYLFNHLQLDTTATESGMRKENAGVLNRAQIVSHSLESLGAGTVMAMKELLQSKLTQFTEENYARDLPPGTPIPRGWMPWDSTRDAIITGRKLDGSEVAVNASKIVPQAVYDTLKALQGKPVNLPLRQLWKGPAIGLWKNLLLTYSPTWYLKHFIGAVTLATVEGVRWQDWMTAYRQFKSDQLPDTVRGRNIYSAIDEVANTRGGHADNASQGTTLSRNQLLPHGGHGSDIPDLVRSEGYRVAAHEINQKFQNTVKVTDSMARAAVYAKTIRTTGDASRAAWRSYEAIGDFGRLSPIERSLVTSIIPFYGFQKAMFRILVHFPADHPIAAGLFMQLGQMQQAYLKEKLGGSLPDAYLGAGFIDGHLMPMDKLNPLTDSYKLATPQGIAASMNPFVKLFAQDALGQNSFGSGIGMDATGNAMPKPDLGQQLMDTYTSAVPGLGNKPIGPDAFSVTKGLSDAQYQKLLARILRTQKAQATVKAGGFVVTDAVKAKKKTP